MVDQECELFSWDPSKDPVALVYSYHKVQAQISNQAKDQVWELVFPPKICLLDNKCMHMYRIITWNNMVKVNVAELDYECFHLSNSDLFTLLIVLQLVLLFSFRPELFKL